VFLLLKPIFATISPFPWGNSQTPDRISAKIVFFVAKLIFGKKFLQRFLQCPTLFPHAEFFAVYRENRVFRPHLLNHLEILMLSQ
jgi:hypothetical protein